MLIEIIRVVLRDRKVGMSCFCCFSFALYLASPSASMDKFGAFFFFRYDNSHCLLVSQSCGRGYVPPNQAPCLSSKKNWLDITAFIHCPPALLYREDVKLGGGLRQQRRKRNIYRFLWFRLWLLSLQTNPLTLDSKTERIHLQAVTRWKYP